MRHRVTSRARRHDRHSLTVVRRGNSSSAGLTRLINVTRKENIDALTFQRRRRTGRRSDCEGERQGPRQMMLTRRQGNRAQRVYTRRTGTRQMNNPGPPRNQHRLNDVSNLHRRRRRQMSRRQMTGAPRHVRTWRRQVSTTQRHRAGRRRIRGSPNTHTSRRSTFNAGRFD